MHINRGESEMSKITQDRSEFPMPENSSFLENDWNLLASFWHPIALSRDVQELPKAVTLLDVPLVIYRTDSGVSVAYDHCPHRGAALSLGRMEEGNLVCPYHAFRYDSEGKCTYIPANGRDCKLPSRMRLITFKAAEKYGLVWACLQDTPRQPLPIHEPFENLNKEFKLFHIEPAIWNTSALRHAENFNDLAHIHTIHDASFGDVNFPLVPNYDVEETETGLYRQVTMPARTRSLLSEPPEPAVPCEFTYTFTYPFSSALVISPPGTSAEEHVFDTISPISATSINVFMVKGRNYCLDDKHLPDLIDYQYATNDEDQAVVESQVPKLVPLNPKDENHIRADKWSTHFRHRWRAMGLVNKPRT